MHTQAMWDSLLLLGYKPVEHDYTKQRESESSTTENDTIKRHGKHKMYETAAGGTWHTI